VFNVAVAVTELAGCALPVVRPVAIVIAQFTRGSRSTPAVSVSVASASPVLADVAEKEPQVLLGVASEPKVKVGITKSTVSEVRRGTFIANLYVIAVGASVTGLAISTFVCMKPALG